MKTMINPMTRAIRFTLAVSLIMFVSLTTVQAQQPTLQAAGKATPEQRAAKLTERMKTDLKLTPAQEPKVLAINLKAATKNEGLKKMTDQAAKQKAFGENQKERETELKAILTPEQFKGYQKMMEEQKANLQKQQPK